MNRQIVLCAIMLLTTSVNASDKVAGWIRNLDMKSKLDGLQSNYEFVRTGCINSYGLVRSTVVNSTVLAKCPELVQGFVKDNFGLLTTITGGLLASGLAWQLHERRYASKFRNGTDEFKERETQKMLPEMGNQLIALSSDAHLLQNGNSKAFSLKPSIFGSVVFNVVVTNENGRMRMATTNCLVPNTAACTFTRSDNQGISATLLSLGGFLRTSQRLIQKTAKALAWTSGMSYHLGSGSFEIAQNNWHEAVNNVLEQGQLPRLLDPKENAIDIAEVQTGMALPSSSPLIGLLLQGDNANKRITMSLLNRISGEQINFALHSAGNLSALERLKKFWVSKHGLVNCIRDIMRDYTLYVPRVGEKERNVRFTALDRIDTSLQKPDNSSAVTTDKRRVEWALVADGDSNKGALIWPVPAEVHLTPYALGDVLGTFLRSGSICEEFIGSRKYIVDIDHQPAQVVELKIEECANNISGLGLTTTDRIITINVNGVQTKCKLTEQAAGYAVDQLDNATLREQIIVALAEAHDWHSKGTTISNEFELRLHENEGQICYQIFDEQGQLSWRTPYISIASSGEEQSAQPNSSGEYTGEGKRIGLDFYWDSAKRFDANQIPQPSSSNNGASSSEDVEQPMRLSRRDTHEWLTAKPQSRRSMSPGVRHELLGHRRVNSMNDMNDINQLIPILEEDEEDLDNPFAHFVDTYFVDEEQGLPDGAASPEPVNPYGSEPDLAILLGGGSNDY